MRDIDILSANFDTFDYEFSFLSENIDEIVKDADKIFKHLMELGICNNYSFNMSDNTLKLFVNPANLVMNANKLEFVISGENPKEGTTVRDIEKKKYPTKDEIKSMESKGIFKNWKRLSNINNEYIFIWCGEKPLTERKFNIRELTEPNIDEITKQNYKALDDYQNSAIVSNIRSIVQENFGNKYFEQYGVRFSEDSQIEIGEDISEQVAINKKDFVGIKLYYSPKNSLKQSLLTLVTEKANDVATDIQINNVFETDDVNVYDIVYSDDDYIYILLRIPNMIQ